MNEYESITINDELIDSIITSKYHLRRMIVKIREDDGGMKVNIIKNKY